VREHFAADPACIHRRGEKYAIWPLKDSLLHACATSISFIFLSPAIGPRSSGLLSMATTNFAGFL
jgi:hypothetical protein